MVEEEHHLLEGIPQAWEDFKAMLLEVELKLENAKNSFRDTLQEMVETFVKEVSKNAKVLLAHQTSLKLEIMFLPKQFVNEITKLMPNKSLQEMLFSICKKYPWLTI